MRYWMVLAALALPSCAETDYGTGAIFSESFVRDTGGVLVEQQSAFDVLHYDLRLQVFPVEQEIDGALTMRAQTTREDVREIMLNLDPALDIDRVVGGDGGKMPIERVNDRVLIRQADGVAFPQTFEVTVHYAGQPRTAPRAPWEGGFQWEQTASGAHWIATSCQMEGADLWWPCKDHPSDKPNSFDLHIRVPSDLVCASNGKLDRVESHEDETATYHWKVSTPIPNYTVALNIGPYEKLVHPYTSVAGTPLPIQFWVLPESVEKARAILPEFADHLRFFEEMLGPYPFRADKYGVVETPHLGMEHQTIIAYGNEFREFEFGYDWLHHHELAHEWFANLVTAPDWNDFWIHEGFGSYMQKLYIEQRDGKDQYRAYLATVRGNINNVKAVAPREPRTSGQMYFLDASAPEGTKPSDSDIYFKGEWVLHSLRWLIGDEALFRSFKAMCNRSAYTLKEPGPDGGGFFTTDDYLELLESETGQELDWFFNLYLRQPALPELQVERDGNNLKFSWKTPDDLPCFMPIQIFVDGIPHRLEMPQDGHTFAVREGASIEIDPFDQVLRKHNHCLEK